MSLIVDILFSFLKDVIRTTEVNNITSWVCVALSHFL